MNFLKLKQLTLHISAQKALIMFCLLVCSGELAAKERIISFTKERMTLSEAFSQIKSQTGMTAAYNEAVLDVKKVVSTAIAAPIDSVLRHILANTGTTYKIVGNQILIGKAKATQTKLRKIEGKVRDADGLPVIGATVVVKGTAIGTSTDAKGAFSLDVPVAQSKITQIEINSLGYEPVVITVDNRTNFDVNLRESLVQLEQVVVTALGIKRSEKSLSYNVQQVSAESILEVKDANFINSLNGKVAGVNINASSSGVGGASKVVLRGHKSIDQSSNALYVIDGIPIYNFGGGGGMEFDSKGASESIADINPEDIASVSVLTGAAASALYGSNAANGAIMITTKKGESGKLRVTVASNTEFLKPFMLPSFQNRYGTGYNGNAEGSIIQSWGPLLNDASRMGYTPEEFFETGAVYSNSVTLSGGSQKNQTFFSAASVNSDGIIPNNKYDRYNFTFRNTTAFLNDKLKLDVSASYIMQTDQNMTNQGIYSNPLVPVYMFPRGDDFSLTKTFERYDPARKIMTMYWPQGEGGDLRMQNPYWIAHRNPRNNEKDRYMLSASLNYEILDWLSVSGRVRVDNSNNLYTQKLYASSNPTIAEGKNGYYCEARRYDKQAYADAMININKTFCDQFSLSANIGASIANTRSNEMSYRGPIRETGLANVFNVFDLDNAKKRAEKIGWREQTQSVFASVELGWKSQLYMTVTGRNDWASQLAGSPQKSFFYPSVGLSWLIGETFELPEAISYLKVRSSFSSVGIPFPRYLTTPTYEYDPKTQQYNPKTHYPIGQLYPERTKTWELGADVRLWNDLNFSVSWYRANTYNQTFDPQLSATSGYSRMYVQTGRVRNMGVEASAGYSHTWNRFHWSSNVTFGWNKNEIIELMDNFTHPVTGELISKDRLEVKQGGLGKAKFILKKGGSLGDLYTTSAIKRDAAGLVEVDNSGNIVILDNQGDIKLGSVFPKSNLAWRNSFSYMGVNLGFLVSARFGGIAYSSTQAWMDLYGVSESSAAARDLGYVEIEGRMKINPQKWYTTISSQNGLPQYYTYSATNVRLQELSLGYTLPQRWFKDVCSIDVSFVGRNLWMIYCKAPFDPESVASTSNYYQGVDYFMMPSLRNMGFSVRIKF